MHIERWYGFMINVGRSGGGARFTLVYVTREFRGLCPVIFGLVRAFWEV